MDFANKPNRTVNHDDKEYWISRSVAISAVLFFFSIEDGKWYLPLAKRWKALPNETWKYCLPCGYLDRNETAPECMRREVWEEVGLDLSDLMRKHQRIWNIQQPFYVYSNPHSHRQNVLLEYFLAFEVENLPTVTNEHSEVWEIAEATWMRVEKACQIDLAFSHEMIIKERRQWIQRDQNKSVFSAW